MWRIKRFINRLSRWYWHLPYIFQWFILILLYILGIYLIINTFVGYIGASTSIWMQRYLFGINVPQWADTEIVILSILSFIFGIVVIGIARKIHKQI